MDRLQQEQGDSAVVSDQGTTRAVAYRGASEAVAGKLTEYAPVNVSLTDRNDPTNPEVFATTIAEGEDMPRLVEVATTGWHEDAEGAHTQAESRAMTLPSIGNAPVPGSFKYAKPKSAGDPAGMPDWGKSCFVVGIDSNST